MPRRPAGTRWACYFPLQNPAIGRASSHRHRVNDEHPLLLDLIADNPETHITFRKSVAVGRTVRGRKTMEACGLNRLKLRERRQDHFDKLDRDESLAEYNIGALSVAEIQRQVAR